MSVERREPNRGGSVPGRRDARPVGYLVAAAGVLLLGGVVSWLPEDVGRDPRPGPGLASGPAAGDPFAAATPEQITLLEEMDLHYRRSVVMLHAKEYAHALVAIDRVLEFAPRLPEAYVNMGFALLGLERFRDAEQAFSTGIDLRPEQANAYFGLAIALEEGGDLGGALGAMRTFIHRTRSDDPFLPRARAALWEWETLLAEERAQAATEAAGGGEREASGEGGTGRG